MDHQLFVSVEQDGMEILVRDEIIVLPALVSMTVPAQTRTLVLDVLVALTILVIDVKHPEMTYAVREEIHVNKEHVLKITMVKRVVDVILDGQVQLATGEFNFVLCLPASVKMVLLVESLLSQDA